MAVAAIYGGSRDNGNSAALADIVMAGIDRESLRLNRYPLVTFQDMRHEPEGFGPIEAFYAEMLHQVLDLPVWVMISPVYWYGLAANLKAFIDGWSHVLRLEEWRLRDRLKGKPVYLVLTGGDNPRLKAMGLVTQFDWIARYMDMKFSGYVIGEGNKPGEVLHDLPAVAQARHLNDLLRDTLRV